MSERDAEGDRPPGAVGARAEAERPEEERRAPPSANGAVIERRRRRKGAVIERRRRRKGAVVEKAPSSQGEAPFPPSRRGDPHIESRRKEDRNGRKVAPEPRAARGRATPPPLSRKKKAKDRGQGKRKRIAHRIIIIIISRSTIPPQAISLPKPAPVFLTVGAANERQQREARAALVHGD